MFEIFESIFYALIDWILDLGSPSAFDGWQDGAGS